MKRKATYQQHRGVFSLMIIGLILTLAALLGSRSPATAADPPDFVVDFPAGTACDFDLQIEIRGGSQVFKEFVDKNDNVVRTLLAGKGSALLFRNVSTGDTFSLKANGSVLHTTLNPDGSRTESATGHNVIILFPTDFPPGPSTTLHVGRVVYTVEPGEVFTLLEVSGKTTDICPALEE